MTPQAKKKEAHQKKKKGQDTERHNPRAFSVANIRRTQRNVQRNLDRAQRWVGGWVGGWVRGLPPPARVVLCCVVSGGVVGGLIEAAAARARGDDPLAFLSSPHH